MEPKACCFSKMRGFSCLRFFTGLFVVAVFFFFIGCGQEVVQPNNDIWQGDPGINEKVPVLQEGDLSSGVGRIAFIGTLHTFGQKHLFLVRPNGKDLISLISSDDRADYTGVSWSPDGQQLAFASNLSGQANYEIYIMKIDGSDRKLIVEHMSGDFAPSWSPDGQQIVYQSVELIETDFDIFVVNVDGTGKKNLTKSTGKEQLPSWSPDGQKIAFHWGDGIGTDIFIMDADGTNRIKLTDGNGSQNASPAWSPDGQRIAFESTRHQSLFGQNNLAEYEIYTINVDGTEIKRVTQVSSPLSSARNPSWSPDNNQIAFEFQRGDKAIFDTKIAVTTINGSGVYQIPNIDFNGQFPRWSPVQ